MFSPRLTMLLPTSLSWLNGSSCANQKPMVILDISPYSPSQIHQSLYSSTAVQPDHLFLSPACCQKNFLKRQVWFGHFRPPYNYSVALRWCPFPFPAPPPLTGCAAFLFPVSCFLCSQGSSLGRWIWSFSDQLDYPLPSLVMVIHKRPSHAS